MRVWVDQETVPKLASETYVELMKVSDFAIIFRSTPENMPRAIQVIMLPAQCMSHGRNTR